MIHKKNGRKYTRKQAVSFLWIMGDNLKNILIPIDIKPEIKTYVDDAYLLSVITKENKNYTKWMTVFYIQLIYLLEPHGHCFSFYSGKYEDCHFVDRKMFPRENLMNQNKFTSQLTKYLTQGYCIIIELNEFYVPDRLSYHNKYRQHSSMVYGTYMKNGERFFNLIGYKASKHYAPTTISEGELYKAFSSLREDTRADGWPIILLRRNNKEYKYNNRRIAFHLKEYWNSGLDEPTYNDGYVLFGLDAARKLIEILKDIKNGLYRKDYRLLSLYMEHKKIMLKRIDHLTETGVKFDEGLINKYEEIYKKSEMCFQLFMRYTITNQGELIDKIVEIIREINAEEEAIFFNIYKSVKNKKFNLNNWRGANESKKIQSE